MKTRQEDALAIDEGACNPVAVINALSRHISDMREAPGFQGWPELTNDPALRLMMHQLAHLFGVLDLSLLDYAAIKEQCEAAVKPATEKQLFVDRSFVPGSENKP